MLSFYVHKNSKEVKEYFKEHLGSGDYYTERGEVSGKWLGDTAKYLGISDSSKVMEADFNALTDSIHPQTGKKLAIRSKKDRIVCVDAPFSPPKSVSIMAITLGDHRLVEAHERAVAVAFGEMERRARTRVRRGLSRSCDQTRISGNLLAAHFTHRSNRELDPQLHTHLVIFNVTHDPVEKRLKALNAVDILNKVGVNYATEIYRNALASEVRGLGYDLEQGRHTWKMRGVSNTIEELFSKRTKQIDQASKELESRIGIKPDKKGRALLSLNSRAEKQKDLREEELLQYQLNQVPSSDLTHLQDLKRIAIQRCTEWPSRLGVDLQWSQLKPEMTSGTSNAIHPDDHQTSNTAIDSIQYAMNHVFARRSVVKKEELLIAALIRSAGRISHADLVKEIQSDQFIHRGDYVMTREERKREVSLVEFVRNGKRLFSELSPDPSLSSTLTVEQKAAAKTILSSKDQCLFLRGAAGTGKTFTLQEITKNISAQVVLTAPGSRATEKLRADGFEAAITTQLFLKKTQDSKIPENSVVIVDEAGLLSTKAMDQLFQIARESKARVLLVGDTYQHNSVEAGDALRLIEEYSVITKAEISTISRQKNLEYRMAIQDMSQGRTDAGLKRLEGLNVVHELNSEERATRVAQEYVEKLKQGVGTIIVTPTWKEHDRITQGVRAELKQNGLLSKEDVVLDVYKSLNFTDVEKRFAPNFNTDLYLSFHSKSGQFAQGGLFRVCSKSNDRVQIEDQNGVQTDLDPKKHAHAFDVVQRDSKGFTIGDVILMKANYASSKINKIPNGSILKIEGIGPDGTIHLVGGKYLKPDFRHFTHGYAVTSQASQGSDNTHVIVSADSQAPGALSANQTYVSSSRGIQSISIYTDSKEKFSEAARKRSSRELALERLVKNGILKDKFIKLKIAYTRKVEMSRDLIDRAFDKFRRKRIRESTPDREKLGAEPNRPN